jgi:hypothetical protein
MATQKSTRKTTATAKSRPNFRSTKRPATSRAKIEVPRSGVMIPIDAVSDVAVKSLKFSVGTALLLSENVRNFDLGKFVAEAIEKGNDVSFPTMPTVALPSFPNLPAWSHMPNFSDLEKQFEKLSEKPAAQVKHATESVREFVDATVRQISNLAGRTGKKAAISKDDLREEVLNIIATLDLAHSADIKRILTQVEKMSKKLDKQPAKPVAKAPRKTVVEAVAAV